MIYDISPTIQDALEIWPSDSPPSREVMLDIKRGANLTLSSRPGELKNGRRGGRCVLLADDYLGPCQVIHVDIASGALIDFAQITVPIVAERVLFATGTFPDSRQFHHDYAALAPELVVALRALGVRLIGLDTPSIDLFDSKEQPAHHAAIEADMAILEGIILRDVPAGIYELISLPLKLSGFDASPVRAILRTIPQ